MLEYFFDEIEVCNVELEEDDDDDNEFIDGFGLDDCVDEDFLCFEWCW